MEEAVKVTAWMASPLVGEVPFLDAIIEYEMAQRLGMAEKIQRSGPCPIYGQVTIPVKRKMMGGVLVPCCSIPIVDQRAHGLEHFSKQLDVKFADLLQPKKRHVVYRGGSQFKSYFLPLNIRIVKSVTWFVVGKRRTILKICRAITSLGQKRGYGYGVVRKWEVEDWEHDWSWMAPCERGKVLMRPLPWCSELPDDLIGYRRDFGAVQPPMWHPERYMERVVPC